MKTLTTKLSKNLTWTVLIAVLALALATSATAQNKMQKCGQIRIVVDLHDGSDWTNDYAELAMLDEAGGWVIMSGARKGENVQAVRGQKLRFNFNDGADHMVDVKCSSKSQAANVKAGSRPAIALVDVTGKNTTTAIHFDIQGSPNPKAKINGCPGGNFYIDVK